MKAFTKYTILTAGLLFGDLATFTPSAHGQGGVPLWTNVYVGAGYDDNAYAVAVDGSGDVFVTGSSAATNEWPYRGNFATIKYSGAGVALWTNRYQGPGNFSDSAGAVALDASGNVFVTGVSYGGGSGYDYATIKYSGAGAALWTNRYTGPGNWDDFAQAIAVDTNGNVFVTGDSTVVINNNGHFEFGTIKYSSTGAALWTRFYRTGPGDGYASDLAVNGSGDVFVTGASYGGGSYLEYATIKYSSTGGPLWTNRYSGSGDGNDYPQAIAVDGSGNVFVIGSSHSSFSSGYALHDYATIKYSGDGVSLWTNRYNGPENSDDVAVAAAVDGSGNAFVTGSSGYITSFGGYPYGYDYATVKYSSAGVPLWTNRYNGPGDGNDYAQAIAVDGSGNVFVTGFSIGSDGTNDYATIAYSSAGVPLWTNRYNGPGNGDDVARGVAVDGSGNLFVTGYSWNGSNNDYVTIKYSPTVVPIHLAIEPATNGGYFIRFNGGPGFTYRLQRAADLTGPWPAIATNTAPASGLVEFHDPTPLPGQAFYRTVQP